MGWELMGQRALRQGDWKITYVAPPLGGDRWELFNLANDASEADDLSADHPDKLRQMQALWRQYASAYLHDI